MSRRPSPAPLAVLCALGACLALAACGGTSPNATGNHQASEERDNEAKLVQFARCLREHGVNVTTSGGQAGGGGGGLKVNGTNPTTMQAAQNACKRYAPAAGQQRKLTPQEQVEHEEQVQRFARCMREHGITVHASATGGGIQIGIEGHGNGPNPESPAFQAAQTTCQKLLPHKGPGPGGGAPVGGPPSSTKGGQGGPSGGATLKLSG
jgi:hypothetical protein